MTGVRGLIVLAAASLALSASCAAAWLAEAATGGGSLQQRMAWLAASLAASGGLLAFVIRRSQSGERQARLILQQLCTLGASESFTDESLPHIERRWTWYEPLVRVKDLLARQAQQVLELEQARTAAELRVRRTQAEGQRLARIVAGLPEAVVAFDHYGAVLLANPSACKLLGIDLGAAEPPVVPQAIRDEHLAALLADALRRKSPASRLDAIEIESPDGQHRSYSVAIASQPGAAASGEGMGDPTEIVAVFRDTSAARLLHRQHAEFVSAASHEMKAPLAGIKAYVELLADGDADDERTREEFLGVIQAQADRLQRLIENLLNLARIEAGVVQVSKQSQSLNDILQEALRVVQPAADARQITLAEELSPLYLGALVDRDMLLQTAINLLSNAIKYTPEGGHVTLRSRLLDREVQFEVEDTGVGLSPEDCRKVFGKFYRVESNKHMAPGTGLGLPLAKSIVEEVHGGRLSVVSRLGAGSTFTVTIPAAARGAAAAVAAAAER